jgi:hypothetical protein
MFTTPGGKFIYFNNSPIFKAVKGVCSAGFITVVQPDAITGATFRMNIKIGKFQGII